MQKPSIPSQSQRYLTEAMMTNAVRTSLAANDVKEFEFFLDSSGLDKIRLGFYEFKYPSFIDTGARFENRILYEVPDDVSTQEQITFLTLQYGSLERAYRCYRDEIEKYIMTSTF